VTIHSDDTVPTIIQVPQGFIENLVDRIDRPPQWWQSPLLVALATGLTAIMSAIVTNGTNRNTQENLKRLEQRLAQDAELGRTRRETVNETMALLGRVMRGAEDRLLLAATYYHKPAMIDSVMAESNAVDAEWRTQRPAIDLWYATYFNPILGNKTWPMDAASIEEYWTCSERTYETYHNTGVVQARDSCKEQHARADKALTHLEKALAADIRSRLKPE
jgi:hypothetical protein